MIKIEVTGNSIGEVADKLLAIGGSLLATDHQRIADKALREEMCSGSIDPIMPELLDEIVFEPGVVVGPAPEVAEEAPAPLPSSGQTEAPQPTEEKASASSPTEASDAPSELNFDTDVAPYVLQVVKEKGKPVAQEILSQFGVEKASLLDPALWPELVNALKGAL